jgi:HK97 gp10 family phage protein
MDAIEIEVKGLEELSRKNNEIVQKIASSGELVAKAALVIEKQAKVNATGRPGPNVQTGRLRSSITSVVDSPLKARVGTNVKYAPFVEFGHSQQVGRFVYAIKRRLVNSRAPAYPFLSPTINQTKDQIQGVMVSFGKEVEETYNK